MHVLRCFVLRPSIYSFKMKCFSFQLRCMAMSSWSNQASLQPMSLTARLTGSPGLCALSVQNLGAVNTVVPSRSKSFDHHFLNRWMARDYKRRVMLKKYTPLRQRYVAMKRCSVLPKELQVNYSEFSFFMGFFIHL